MAVEIACGNCGNAFGVQPEWAGMAVECPFCQVALQVPSNIGPEGATETATENASPTFQIDTSESTIDPPGITIDTGRNKPPAEDVPFVEVTAKGGAQSKSTNEAKNKPSEKLDPKKAKQRQSRWKTRPNKDDAKSAVNKEASRAPKPAKKTKQSQPDSPTPQTKGSISDKDKTANKATGEPSARDQVAAARSSMKSKSSTKHPTGVEESPKTKTKSPIKASKSSTKNAGKTDSISANDGTQDNGKVNANPTGEEQGIENQPSRNKTKKDEVSKTVNRARKEDSEFAPSATAGSRATELAATTEARETDLPAQESDTTKNEASGQSVAQRQALPNDVDAKIPSDENPDQGSGKSANQGDHPEQRQPREFDEYPLAFPPTIWHSQSLASQVDVVVRTGVKEIEYHGEKVLIRDDQNARNVYQIAGFVISLIILVVVLTWITFK